MGRILFITNLLPFPLDNGGKIKTYNTIVALSQHYEIDLLSFVNNIEDKKNISGLYKYVSSCKVIAKTLIRSTSRIAFMKDYLKSLISKRPYSINKFYEKNFEEECLVLLKENKYDFVYVDHLPMMVYRENFKGLPILLDQHNVESEIFNRMVKNDSNILKMLLGRWEYFKLKKFEYESMLQASHIISLSENDKSNFVRLGINQSKISVLPIHINVSYLKKWSQNNSEDNLNILFLGSMSWYPNQEGIRWFLGNVWPRIDSLKFNLYIVGGNPPKNITDYHNGSNIFVTGYVDNVDEFIEKCHLSIVPLFIGSGQRVKIIESFGKNLPVLSTTIGAEGLIYNDEENILIANEKEEFIEKLIQLKSQPEILKILAINGRKNFEANYSSELLPTKLIKIINKMMSEV